MANQIKYAVTSDVDKNMREVAGGSTMKGTNPGSSRIKGISIEGLGSLEEFPVPIPANEIEGVGPHCVVLSDVLTVEGEAYTQGEVHRLSKLVAGYEQDDKDAVKQSIRRIFELGAIRLATKEEALESKIILDMSKETDYVNEERSKRIELENENEQLKAQLEKLQGSTATSKTKGHAASSGTDDETFD